MPPKPKANNNPDINASNSNSSPTQEKKFQTPRAMKPNNDIKIDSSNIDASTAKTKKVKLKDRDIRFQIKKRFHKMFLFDVFPEDVLDIILGSLFLINILKGDYLYKKQKFMFLYSS